MTNLGSSRLGEGDVLAPLRWSETFDQPRELAEVHEIDALGAAQRQAKPVGDQCERARKRIQLVQLANGRVEVVVGNNFQKVDFPIPAIQIIPEDRTISIPLGGAITLAITVTAVAAFFVTGIRFDDLLGMAKPLESLLGPAAAKYF